MDLLQRDLLRIGVKWGEGISREGKPYGWLIDSREFLLQADHLERVCAELGPLLASYEFDSLAGYTLAAHPLALGLRAWFAERGRYLNVNLIRREPKVDGLQRQVEGPPIQAGQRVILVDDLVNSGSTQVSAVRLVRQAGGTVAAVAVLLDYERSGGEWLRSQRIPLLRLFTLSQLGIQKPVGLPALRPVWQKCGLNQGNYNAPKSSACLGPDRLWIGSDQGYLMCLRRTGEELWRFQVRDCERGIHGTPCHWDGKVVFGAYDGYLYCLAGESGKLLWELRPGQWIGASPLVDQGQIFVGVEYGEMGGSLIAVDGNSGRQLWEAPAGHYVHSGACLAGGLVVFGCNDGVVRAVERADGRPAWKFYTEGPVKSDLVSDGQHVLVAGGDGLLYCLEAANGHLLWKRRLSRQLYCRPLLLNNLVVAGGDGTCLIATRLQNGEVVWSAPLGSVLVGGACLAGGQIWASASNGTIGCFSLDGEALAYFESEQPIRNRPAGDSEQVFVAAMTGDLYAFDCSQSQRS